jgi:hypothetical protein
MARAALELALARARLGDDHSRRLRESSKEDGSLTPLSSHQLALIDRVAFTVPRVAARVPWRADCLVQSLAAKHWLDRDGVPSQLVIGVRKDGALPLDAHAWLKVGDRVVVGGDVGAYVPMTP